MPKQTTQKQFKQLPDAIREAAKMQGAGFVTRLARQGNNTLLICIPVAVWVESHPELYKHG